MEENSNSVKEQNPYNRESLLQSTKKKSYLGLSLMILGALLLLFVLSSSDKKKEEEAPVEFEPAAKRQIIIPQAPPPPVITERLPSTDELERLKREEALRATRLKSAIVVYGSANTSGSGTSEASTGSQNPNIQFQQQIQKHQEIKATVRESLDQTILQGKMIDAVLETAIQSDLPGMTRAVVSSDIYGESGNHVLIPRGSRLLGQYNSEVRKGQSRVFVIWTRVIRPDGVEVTLNSGGTDPLGRAGIGGSVNHHFWQMFGASTLLSIIGAGTATAGVSPEDGFNSASAYRQQMSQSFQNTSSSILSQYINIPPTIEIKQGKLIKVFVAHDLDFTDALASLSPNQGILIP